MKLADGKARTIQHMMATTFWHPDGTPMSAQQFMELLFGRLPEFFKDETELRAIWSAPDTPVPGWQILIPCDAHTPFINRQHRAPGSGHGPGGVGGPGGGGAGGSVSAPILPINA